MTVQGVNTARLSKRSGISTAAISRYLNGLRQPTMENLVILADVLDTSLDYLLGRTDEPKMNKLIAAYAAASCEDRHKIWNLLNQYGGKRK